MKSLWGYLLFIGVGVFCLGAMNYLLERARDRLGKCGEKWTPNRNPDTESPSAQFARDYSRAGGQSAGPLMLIGGLLAIVGLIGVLAR